NFPPHINQIEELGLPAEEYAIAMADALAFLHWAPKVDANDVEFVITRPHPPNQSRSALDSRPGIGSREFTSAFGLHAMWILDFDCCRELSMDESGIEQAAKSFWRNDPYYPRPGSSSAQDQELWHVFKTRFLHASGLILKEEDEAVRQLPGRLVARIIETRGTWTNGLGP
ncbi:zinc finger protein-domain-containing protein, partial [Phialemonium atrogriseum]